MNHELFSLVGLFKIANFLIFCGFCWYLYKKKGRAALEQGVQEEQRQRLVLKKRKESLSQQQEEVQQEVEQLVSTGQQVLIKVRQWHKEVQDKRKAQKYQFREHEQRTRGYYVQRALSIEQEQVRRELLSDVVEQVRERLERSVVLEAAQERFLEQVMRRVRKTS